MRSPKYRFEIRKKRVRSSLSRVSDRPRLSIFKSGRHIYAQIIDDSKGITLASASTLDKEFPIQNAKTFANKKSAEVVGSMVAKRAAMKGVAKVVFDKGGYKYHGVVKVLAEAARQELEF